MVLAVARFTFREAVRKRVLLGAAVLSLGFLGLYAVAAFLSHNDFAGHAGGGVNVAVIPVAASFLALAGLYVVNFLAGALAIFTAVGTIAGEIDSGTLHSILPKPISRWQVLLGKWLGYALMLVAYLALMSAAVVLIIYFSWGVLLQQPVFGIAVMGLSTLLLLSLTILGSTIFTALANGIVVFMLYGVGLMGGFVEQIGSLLQNDTMVNIGIVSSLIIPSDVLWKMASYLMQTHDMISRAVVTPFFGGSPPSPAMIAYAVAYTAVAVGLAIAIFARRDL